MGVASAVRVLWQGGTFSKIGYALIMRLKHHHILMPGVVDVLRVILLLLHGVTPVVTCLLLWVLEIALRNLML